MRGLIVPSERRHLRIASKLEPAFLNGLQCTTFLSVTVPRIIVKLDNPLLESFRYVIIERQEYVN